MMTSSEKQSPETAYSSRVWRWIFNLGAFSLLLAMAVDTLAVLGRHIGMPFPGSIELVQAAILVASSAAILSATLANKHARVHLLMDRMKGRPLAVLRCVQTALSVLFFCSLAAGSIWIFIDLWGGLEETEVLHIPLAPLRIVSIISVLGVVFGFLSRFREGPSS
jgi:TRAP-type C4-dicarboxylate transport system permease small subunit